MGERAQCVVHAEPEPTAEAAGRTTSSASIDDDGPGLDDERARGGAGARPAARRIAPGSGLGLSIVVDLAAAYGGALRLEQSPLGGLRATLRLPRL